MSAESRCDAYEAYENQYLGKLPWTDSMGFSREFLELRVPYAPYEFDAAGTGDGTRVGEPSPHTVTPPGTPAQRRRAGGWTEMHTFAIDLGKSAFSSRTCGERLRASPIELRGARRHNVPAFRKKGGSVVGGYGSARYQRR